MSERKLGIVKEIVEATGMSIAHVYEDLVFLNHNALLLQFTEENSRLLLRVNREAEQEAVMGGVLLLKQAALEHGMQFADGGGYALAQDGDDSVRLEFSTEQT